MPGSVGGVDHCIVLVRDLAAAREAWERLGFRSSPRGVHSAHMGTANHTLMLADDYIELLGTVSETEQNAKWRARLSDQGEGIVAIALRAFDAEAASAELASRGAAILPVQHFGRAVALPGAGTIEARFDTFRLQDEIAPGFRLFFCRHLVPGATWPPGLMDHPNGSVAIDSFTIRATDADSAAAATARLLGRAVTAGPDKLPSVETGRARLGFAAADGEPAGIEAIALRVRDLDIAARALEAGGIAALREEGGLSVPRSLTNGVSLRFVRA